MRGRSFRVRRARAGLRAVVGAPWRAIIAERGAGRNLPRSWIAILIASLPIAVLVLAPRAKAADAPRPAPAPAPEIVAWTSAQMDALHVPGCGLALVGREGEPQVFGLGSAGGDRPMTGDTPSLIGSLTKSFTAIAVLALVEDGRVELDQPVRRYLPQFALAGGDGGATITVRHLLNQTSGIPRRAGLEGVYEGRTVQQVVERLRRVRPAHAPGEKFVYSNANYWVLEALVEAVSGRSYGDWLRERALLPMDMKHAHVSREAAERDGLADGHRMWFGFAVDERMPDPTGHVVAASAADLAKLVRMALDEGRVGGRTVLSPASVRAMLTPPAGKSYAMGWQAGDLDGIAIRRHSGAAANYRAEMGIVPERGVGFALVCDAYHHMQDDGYRRIARGITAMLVGREPPPAEGMSFPRRVRLWALALAVPVLLSLRSLRRVNRFRVEAFADPRAGRRPFYREVARLALNVAVLVVVASALPRITDTPNDVLMSFVPDLALLVTAALVIPIVASAMRVGIAAPTLWRPRR